MPLILTRTIGLAVLAAGWLLVACTLPNPDFRAVDASATHDAGGAEAREAPELPDIAEPAELGGAMDALDAEPETSEPEVAPPDTPAQPDVNDVAPVEVAGPDVVAADAGCTPMLGTGTGLAAEYFANIDFTSSQITRTDATIDWSWGTSSPGTNIDDDNFSVRWLGQLQPTVSGPHTFFATYNDGIRVLLDQRVVLYRWGPHITNTEDSAAVMLEAGRKYDLRVEYFDQGGAAIARLEWQNPCQSRQVVPRRQLYPAAPAAPVCLSERPAGTGTGLKLEYFAGEPGSDRALATVNNSRVDFAWGTPAPATGVPANFSSRWTGKLEAPIDGPLTIYLATDDIGRVRLGGAVIMDSWSEPFGPQEIAATIDVRAGQRYDLVVDHRDNEGGALAHLYWSWPCHPREVVPTTRLYAP